MKASSLLVPVNAFSLVFMTRQNNLEQYCIATAHLILMKASSLLVPVSDNAIKHFCVVYDVDNKLEQLYMATMNKTL
jgi:hypothetical protein